MTKVIFYEKPGCINNTRQKKMLVDAGHQLDVRNLLAEQWDEDGLMCYFTGLPVAQWFNSSAPQIKSGEIMAEEMKADDAIRLMLDNPLLIRRPLMRVGSKCRAGFDQSEVADWIGLKPEMQELDLETCPRINDDSHLCKELI